MQRTDAAGAQLSGSRFPEVTAQPDRGRGLGGCRRCPYTACGSSSTSVTRELGKVVTVRPWPQPRGREITAGRENMREALIRVAEGFRRSPGAMLPAQMARTTG